MKKNIEIVSLIYKSVDYLEFIAQLNFEWNILRVKNEN